MSISNTGAGHHAPALCTLEQLRGCLQELGMPPDSVAPTAIGLLREGEVRLVGPYADALSRMAGVETRRH